MSRLERQVAAPAVQHPLPKAEFQRLAAQAWDSAFIPAMRYVPHVHDDPELVGITAGQRRHVQGMLVALAGALAERCVAAGLYPSVQAFFDDEASDPASAGVDRAGGES